MAAKRGSKRAAATGGTGKKRGRPSKKQKEEEAKADEAKQEQQDEKDEKDNNEGADKEEQQPTDASTDNKDNTDQKQSSDDTAQPADESKSDKADADTEMTKSSSTDEASKDGDDEQHKAELLEKGRLYFFYRPKVDAKEVKGTGDVQKFYILMSPEGAEGKPANEEEAEKNRRAEREASKESSEGGKKHRLLVVSSKMLPPEGQRARNPWSFVDAVGSLEEVEQKLERYSYDTKTRGHREIQPARLCGEARYELIKTQEKTNNPTTHIVYELEVPEKPGDVQHAFGIAQEAQFLINVKNPDFESAARSERPYAGFKPDAKAQIPAHLMEHFKGKRQAEVRYCPVLSTEFLDLQHAELVMIGVKKGVKDETGEEFQKLVEQLEEDAENDHESEEKAYEELKMDEKEHPSAIEEFK